MAIVGCASLPAMSRVVAAAVVDYADGSAGKHLAIKGQIIQPSTAEEARLEAAKVLAPASATPQTVEAEAQAKNNEYSLFKQGHGPEPAWLPGEIAKRRSGF